MRGMWLIAVVGLAACGMPAPGAPTLNPAASAGLQQAARNYPPLILGANTVATPGPNAVRACPEAGSRVEQKGGPTINFLGAVPGKPDLCRMNVGGETVEGWYGIWLTDWPGVESAYPALTRVMHGTTGHVEGFDVDIDPRHRYHDLIRNEGIERINLLGKIYTAIKVSHYREGYGTNVYRSVSTVWKDLPTGLLIYATYQHISGTPVLEDPLIPTAIVEAR
ncbi:MAG: hypothetical protein ACRYF2_11975 [Janthinobacterium lividum]